MPLKSLREELDALELITAQELKRELSEGKHHEGLCALVQIVSLKV